jgi:hypothetical protein
MAAEVLHAIAEAIQEADTSVADIVNLDMQDIQISAHEKSTRQQLPHPARTKLTQQKNSIQ